MRKHIVILYLIVIIGFWCGFYLYKHQGKHNRTTEIDMKGSAKTLQKINDGIPIRTKGG